MGAIGFGPRSFCLWEYQQGKARTSDPTTVTVGASMRMTRHLATSTPERAAARVTATIPPVAISDAWCLVEGYVEHYNNARLNSAIGYITPKDMLAGRQQEIHGERDRTLEAAREQRKNRRQRVA